MRKWRIFELYYKNLKKPTILNGLVLHPFLVDNKIVWELENPKDLSYSSYVVEGNLEDLVVDFFNMMGIDANDTGFTWAEISTRYCRLSKSDVYINSDLTEKIRVSLENLKSINFETYDGKFYAECFVKDWNVEYIDEHLYFGIHLELHNPKIDNVDVSYDEADEYLKELQYDDDYPEIETNIVDEQLSFFTQDKNLFGDGYMIYNGSVYFYDAFGIRLGY
jgi:hypothetical protein